MTSTIESVADDAPGVEPLPVAPPVLASRTSSWPGMMFPA